MGMCISKLKPTCPIIAVTGSQNVYRRLAAFYGVFPVLFPAIGPHYVMRTRSGETSSTSSASSSNETIPVFAMKSTDQILVEVERIVRQVQGHLLPDRSPVVLVAGHHEGFPGLSNTLKLANFGDAGRYERARERWRDAYLKIKAGATANVATKK